MLKDVMCICGAEFKQVDLEATAGWFTCPKCKCTTKPCVRQEPKRQGPIPEFDMQSLAKAFKENRI